MYASHIWEELLRSCSLLAIPPEGPWTEDELLQLLVVISPKGSTKDASQEYTGDLSGSKSSLTLDSSSHGDMSDNGTEHHPEAPDPKKIPPPQPTPQANADASGEGESVDH